jgi:periplasmic protein TonB
MSAAAGYEWYGGLSVARGEAALQKQRRLAGQKFQVVVELWLNADGSVDHVNVVRSTGKPEIDEVIDETLTAMAKLPQPPPKDMPMPVVLRYAST